MDTSPGVFPSRLAISDVELGVSPPISAMAVRYRLPGVEALCHLDEYSPSSSSRPRVWFAFRHRTQRRRIRVRRIPSGFSISLDEIRISMTDPDEFFQRVV